MNLRFLLFVLVCSTILASSVLSQPLKKQAKRKVSKGYAEYAWIKNLPDSLAIDTLTKIYNDTNTQYRIMIIEALRSFDRKVGIQVVRTALRDSSQRVRSDACWDIDAWHDTSDVPLLISKLKDESRDVRYVASHALRRFADPRAVTPLLELLDKKNGDAVSPLVYDLEPYNDDRINPKLIDILNSQEYEARYAAVTVLDQRRDTLAVPALTQMLNDTNIWLQHQVISTLGQIGDSRAVPALLDLLAVPDTKTRYYVMDVLRDLPDSTLIQRFLTLSKKSGYPREVVLMGIAECGSKEADSVFTIALKQKKYSTIAAGYRYYIRKGDSSDIPILKKVLQTNGNFMMAMDYYYSGQDELKQAADKWYKLIGVDKQDYDAFMGMHLQWGQPRKKELRTHQYNWR